MTDIIRNNSVLKDTTSLHKIAYGVFCILAVLWKKTELAISHIIFRNADFSRMEAFSNEMRNLRSCI